jgi:hypothetical protein
VVIQWIFVILGASAQLSIRNILVWNLIVNCLLKRTQEKNKNILDPQYFIQSNFTKFPLGNRSVHQQDRKCVPLAGKQTPKAFFTPHHGGHCCALGYSRTVIWDHRCATLSHCCATCFNSDPIPVLRNNDSGPCRFLSPVRKTRDRQTWTGPKRC